MHITIILDSYSFVQQYYRHHLSYIIRFAGNGAEKQTKRSWLAHYAGTPLGAHYVTFVEKRRGIAGPRDEINMYTIYHVLSWEGEALFSWPFGLLPCLIASESSTIGAPLLTKLYHYCHHNTSCHSSLLTIRLVLLSSLFLPQDIDNSEKGALKRINCPGLMVGLAVS